ncbi:MAG TPA: glycosyltransferase family 2 protein [Chloroflexota bacterium]|nr:glycosyltransferase family 2 protein [Chloroflexota bacterium]
MQETCPPHPLRVAAVIPARDEEQAIGKVIAALPRDLIERIIVVDNGSTDGTARIARESGAQVVSVARPGYGRACAAGAAAAGRADVILFLDGDYSDFPEEARLILAPILGGTADLVLGSRLRGRRQKGALPPHQLFGNWLISGMMRLLYGTQVTDLGPFRAIHADLLGRLEMREMTYGWPVEMMVKAARSGARIKEVPVSYRKRIGKSKISGTIRGSVLAAYAIIGVTLRYALLPQSRARERS